MYFCAINVLLLFLLIFPKIELFSEDFDRKKITYRQTNQINIARVPNPLGVEPNFRIFPCSPILLIDGLSGTACIVYILEKAFVAVEVSNQIV